MALRREVKVGAFVLAGLAAMGAVIFLIGDERQLFQSKETYKALFQDVQGLRRGSPVRMGGVDVGTVLNVDYGADEADKNIHVTLSIVSAEARRVRQDTVATIEGKGLLGDKMIVLSVGTLGKPMLPDGATIHSREAEDIAQMMARLGTISSQVEKVVSNLERTTNSLADETFQGDLKASAASLSRILAAVDHGNGYVGRVLHDPAEADRLSQVVTNASHLTAELDRGAVQVNAILSRVNGGPGFAHEVLYGEEGSKVIAQFGGAAAELQTTLKGIRDGNGLAKSLIYGDDASQKLMGNLNQMSGDLQQIVGDVRAGRGTLGALLVDPSVYDDLKLLLGNVQRNKALRALVRYSIQRDEKAGSGQVRDPVLPRVEPTEARANGATHVGKGDVSGE